MTVQAHVLYCVEFDAANTCVREVWMPAPQLLPPLDPTGAMAILAATAVLFAVAWGAKQLGRTIRA